MGLLFDVVLLLAILCSVIVVCLETVESLETRYGDIFVRLEWLFTILFTIEYVLRLYCVKRPLKYATSFFGIVDLLAFLPSYLQLLMGSTPNLAVIRAFRLLRVFRIFKLIWFMKEADELGRAIHRAWGKVVVFLGVVAVSITVAGTLMFAIENRRFDYIDAPEKASPRRLAELKNEILTCIDDNDFDNAESALEELRGRAVHRRKSKFNSIPESMYWATVTMTTVGYGDIVPTTTLGKLVAAVLILLGYSLIIVPTGFVSAEFMESKKREMTTQSCPYCMLEVHDRDAIYCRRCGKPLNDDAE